jgi:hypothetical protein
MIVLKNRKCGNEKFCLKLALFQNEFFLFKNHQINETVFFKHIAAFLFL